MQTSRPAAAIHCIKNIIIENYFLSCGGCLETNIIVHSIQDPLQKSRYTGRAWIRSKRGPNTNAEALFSFLVLLLIFFIGRPDQHVVLLLWSVLYFFKGMLCVYIYKTVVNSDWFCFYLALLIFIRLWLLCYIYLYGYNAML